MTAGERELGMDARQVLLLRALLSPADEARRSAEAWLEQTEIDSLDSASTAILPGLHTRLLALGVQSNAAGKLKGVQRHHWYRNRLLWLAAVDAVRRLEQADLRPVLCGGIASLPLHHRNWGSRRLESIDVLVAADDLGRAMSTLAGLGWMRLPPNGARLTPAYQAAQSAVALGGVADQRLLLRWRLCDWGALPNDDVRWQAVDAEIEGERLRVFSAADLLIMAAVGERAEAVFASLTWAVDTGALVSAGHVDWPRVLELAAALRVSRLLHRRLGWLRRGLGVEVPDGVLDALRRSPSSAGERLTVALHGARAELGPAAYRAVCHLRRCRRLARTDAMYRGAAGMLRYIGEVHGLAGAGAVGRHLLRRGLQLARRR